MALWRGGVLRAAARLNPTRAGVERPVWSRGFAVAAQHNEIDLVKEKYIQTIETFYKLLNEFKKFRIVIDPDDDKAVKEFSDNILKARQNAGLPSYEERSAQLLTALARRSKTVRQYYERLARFQASKGEEDVEGNKAIFDVITKVEGKIGKQLTLKDKQGMQMFEEESAAALCALDTDPKDFNKYVKETNLDFAKGLLMEMKEGALESIQRNKIKEYPEIHVNFRDLDIRNVLRLPGESLGVPREAKQGEGEPEPQPRG